jgi:hypothetical protein
MQSDRAARHQRPVRTGTPAEDRKAGHPFLGWITSAGGAVASLLGVATAILGLFTAVQQQQIHRLHQQVKVQQQQITHLQLNPVSVPSAPEDGHFLSNLSPTIDNSNAQPGPIVINGVTYPSSITFGCWGGPGIPVDEAYKVAGSQFTAVIGLSDADAGNDSNIVDTLTITDQAGRIIGNRINVSAGHPLKVDLPLAGINELQFSCTDRNVATGATNITAPVSIGNGAT